MEVVARKVEREDCWVGVVREVARREDAVATEPLEVRRSSRRVDASTVG